MNKLKSIYNRVYGSTFLNNQAINNILRGLILLGVGYSLYAKFVEQDDLPQMVENIEAFIIFPNLYLLLGALFLMPLILWAESYRWLIFVKKIVLPKSQTLRTSIKAMLTGQTLAMFIPYRIGKIGGRVMVYESKKKWELVAVNFFDGEAVKLLYDALGLLGASYVGYAFFKLEIISVVLGSVLISLILLARLYFFFNIGKLTYWLKRFPSLDKVVVKLEFVKEYTRLELFKVLQIALFRVLLNFLQYYLLLRFFGIEVGILKALVLIGGIYFFVANIPLPALVGLLARIHIALFVWGHYSDNIISISSIPFLLWIFNALIPALGGAVFMLKMNIAKNLHLSDKVEG